jgi:H+/gluconate symporter-like permease
MNKSKKILKNGSVFGNFLDSATNRSVLYLAVFLPFPSFSFVFPVFTVLNRKTFKQAKNHHRTKKTKKTEKNQKSSPDPKMHRTVAKTVLHTCLATGTSNAHAVVLQQKNVQKTPFLTPKTVLFGPPISDPGPLVAHKTAKI